MGCSKIIEAGASIYVGRTSPVGRAGSRLKNVIECQLFFSFNDTGLKQRIVCINIIEAGASIYVGRTSPVDRVGSHLKNVIECQLSFCFKDKGL